MRFINTTGNTINISDIDRIVLFLGENEQEIDSDSIRRSQVLQQHFMLNKFRITEASQERIEQNMLRYQRRELSIFDEQTPSVVPISIRGSFGGHTGYGKSNRNLLYGLNRVGVRAVIHPESPPLDGLNAFETTRLERFRQYVDDSKGVVIHSTIPCFAANIQARYRILMTTVESATIPLDFLSACEIYDEIWVASDFCKEVFISYGVQKPITVIPNGIDTRLYNLSAKPHIFNPPLKPFVFVSVFAWSWRKGYDALLRSYLSEFKQDDDVSLLIVAGYERDDKGDRKMTVEGTIKKFIEQYGGDKPAHIARCGRDIQEYEMPRVYRACNAFVLPTRGEGFGIPFMEASLCGLPVIATNYGGQTMFLNKDNSFLFDIDTLASPDGKAQIHYWENQLFPKLIADETIGNISRAMRQVYEDYPAAQEKNEILREEIETEYSSDIVGAKARERLEEIWSKL